MDQKTFDRHHKPNKIVLEITRLKYPTYPFLLKSFCDKYNFYHELSICLIRIGKIINSNWVFIPPTTVVVYFNLSYKHIDWNKETTHIIPKTSQQQLICLIQVSFVYLKGKHHDYSRLAQAIITAAREKQIAVHPIAVYHQPYHYESKLENYTRNPFLDIVRDTYKDTRSK